MKRIIFLLFISTTVFAQTPRLKFRQIQKDTTQGSIAISNPADSQLVFSRDFYISYGVDTVLILYGDTLGGVGGGFASVLSDGVTITGDGSVGNPLKVDTATVISTIQGLVDSLSNYVTIAGTQTITGAKTFSTDVEIDGKLDLNDGSNRVFVGTSAGFFNTGSESNGFGHFAVRNNTGNQSNGFGFYALQSNTGVNSNGFGSYALANNTGASSNGFGHLALQNNTGTNSNGFGYFALRNNKASNNTAIGHQAGYETSDLTGGSNTFLGYNASYGANTTITNATAVGANVTLSNSNTVILGNGADVGIGTDSPNYDLEVTGKIYASDSIISNVYAGTSDIRLKQDIEPTDKGLDAVMELNPVSYRFIANADSEKKSYGFIAQEIEKVIPDVVGTRHDGMKILNYNDLISVLTKAIQEQQTEIDELKLLITDLTNRLIKLENK